MDKKILRFQQRHSDFCRALAILVKQSERDDLADENVGATLHFFEMTFELGWKSLKDILEKDGHIIKSPREAIKKAFEFSYLEDAEVWLDMLEDRNVAAHAYNEKKAQAVYHKVKKRYIHALIEWGEFKCLD